MSRFLILCKHESESDKIKKWLLELRCAISKANNIARASAVKIDEWLGSRLLLRNAHSLKFKMAATAILNFENCCYFFNIGPISTKVDGNLTNYYRTQLSRRNAHSPRLSRRHLEFRKMFAIPLLFDKFSPNLVGMLQLRQLRFRIHLLSRK